MTAEFTPATRKAVFVRAWFACERCGGDDGLQIHHRRPRQAGGTSDPAARSAANALLLDDRCHRWIESHRTWAEAQGWLVRSGVDPASVPVLIFERGRVLLTPAATYGRSAA